MFRRLRNKIFFAILLMHLLPLNAEAADFEATLQNLVGSVIGRILPILALGYVAKNIFGHIQSDPNAKRETVTVVIAVVALLGIQGVWSWMKAQVR